MGRGRYNRSSTDNTQITTTATAAVKQGMPMDMNGKTVAITGASRGIGAAAALAFAEAGANVALLSRDQVAIGDLAARIGVRSGVRIGAFQCDVADYSQVATALTATHAQFGSLDVLINNAGAIEPISHIATSDPDNWGRIIDVNLKGVYHGVRAALPHMLAAGGGTILSLSSGAAHGPTEAWSHYCASKAGVHNFNRCIDKENRDLGIRAMTLSPGTVATRMQREIKASGINPISRLDWSDHIPPEWAARALVWMCSAGADPWLGGEVSLRDADVRRAVGLPV